MKVMMNGPLSNQPDSRILQSAKYGDIAAFEQLLSFYEKAIFNHLYRLAQNREDAADLTQETFIKLFKNRSKIDPEGHFRAYLYKIATNTALDWLRKRDKSMEIFIIDDTESSFETIESKAAYNSIAELDSLDLEQAMSKLKPEYQIVIDLYYRQGFEYAEIAQMLSKPINTIKTHLRRAKEEMRAFIA